MNWLNELVRMHRQHERTSKYRPHGWTMQCHAVASYRLCPCWLLALVSSRHVTVQVHDAGDVLNAWVACGKGDGVSRCIGGIRPAG